VRRERQLESFGHRLLEDLAGGVGVGLRSFDQQLVMDGGAETRVEATEALVHQRQGAQHAVGGQALDGQVACLCEAEAAGVLPGGLDNAPAADLNVAAGAAQVVMPEHPLTERWVGAEEGVQRGLGLSLGHLDAVIGVHIFCERAGRDALDAAKIHCLGGVALFSRNLVEQYAGNPSGHLGVQVASFGEHRSEDGIGADKGRGAQLDLAPVTAHQHVAGSGDDRLLELVCPLAGHAAGLVRWR